MGAPIVKILGPVRIGTGADEVAPSGAKQRLLLAMLASRAGRPVPVDVLIDVLWSDRQPADRRHALENHVSRLRRLFGADVEAVRRVAEGYQLVAENLDIDARRSEELLRRGRDAVVDGRLAQGLGMLRSAERLWRGPPFADVPDRGPLAGEIARLEGLRRRCDDVRFDTELALGHHEDVVDELVARLAGDELDERRRAQLMMALYGSGRQAEALDLYDEGARILVETLGIDPGPELRQARLRILRQQPWPTSMHLTRGGSASGRPFVGRDGELEAWRRVTSRLLEGRGDLLMFSGEPGIGKSRLLEVIAESGVEIGFDVVWGRCREETDAPHFWPWIQILRSLRTSGTPVDGLPATILHGAGDQREGPTRESDRFRLFAEVADVLVTASRIRPLVVVLDDLHAADRSSLQLLDVSTDVSRKAPIAFVGAYRTRDAAQRGTERSLARIARHGTVLPLAGLAREETTELLHWLLGDEPVSVVVDRIHDAGDGNPLFTTELARRSADRPLNAEPDNLPPVLDALIRQRLNGLATDARECLEVMAVLGREVEVPALEAVAAIDGATLRAGLEDAVSAGIVDRTRADSYRFCHVLFRDVLERDLPSERRLDAHEAIASWLETLPPGRLRSRLPELAHHHLALVPRHGTRPAVAWLRRAGDAAAGEFAWEQAADLYETAAANTPDLEQRAELLVRQAEMQRRSGEGLSAMDVFERAFTSAASVRRHDLMCQAAIGSEDARWRGAGNDDAGPVVELLQRALAGLPPTDTTQRVQLLARLSRAAHYWDVHVAATAGLQAGALADDLSDAADVAIALEGHRWGLWTGREGPTFAQRGRLADQMLTHAHRAGDDELTLRALLWKLHDTLEAGDVPAVDRSLPRIANLAASVHQPRYVDWVRVCEAMRLLRLGHYDEARSLRASLAEPAERLGDGNVLAVLLGQTIIEAIDRGEVAGSCVREIIRDSVIASPALGRAFRPMLPLLEAEAGDEEAARDAFADLTPDRFAAVPPTLLWSTDICMLALATPWIQDQESAATLVELLRPWAGNIPMSGPEVYFWGANLGLGVAALVAGHHREARRYLTDACRQHERIHAPAWLARSQFHLAQAYMAGPDRDPSAASDLLTACITATDRFGLRSLGNRARALLGDR